ncbi:MAG: rhomboid family intramembrane serine protease [Candidatus Marinimicrobia bacterium]|nr:rhomboid family intramembrane serine protease [Candidatus Neomarinimicrobiota bacterium]
MRYQYTSPGFRNRFGGGTSSIPDGVKLLLILNIIVFLLVEISDMQFELFYSNFGLVPAKVWSSFMIWQPITYLFLHGGFIHLLFNMFVLWMFGKDLENQWGFIPFLKYYFACGIGAGVITSFFGWGSYTPVIGASGAIYGLLLAYGLTYPNRLVYLYGIFPIKVKFMVIGMGVIAFFASMTSENSTVSHITHIAGMVMGLMYLQSKINFKHIKLWLINRKINSLNIKITQREDSDIKLRKRVDKILEKLNTDGWDGLTKDEQKMLHKASKTYSENRPPN